jgi:hypothetical protein
MRSEGALRGQKAARRLVCPAGREARRAGRAAVPEKAAPAGCAPPANGQTPGVAILATTGDNLPVPLSPCILRTCRFAHGSLECADLSAPSGVGALATRDEKRFVRGSISATIAAQRASPQKAMTSLRSPRPPVARAGALVGRTSMSSRRKTAALLRRSRLRLPGRTIWRGSVRGIDRR